MQPNRHGWFSMRGSARQGKMRDKQGRNDPSAPVTPEVAVQSDGGLRRPAQEAARPAAPVASADATTALEAALSARIKRIYSTPPPPPPYSCSTHLRFSGSRNPLDPTHLPLHSAPAHVERAPSGPRSPSATSQRGLHLLCSPVPANPAGFRPDGAFPLGTDVPLRPFLRHLPELCGSWRGSKTI